MRSQHTDATFNIKPNHTPSYIEDNSQDGKQSNKRFRPLTKSIRKLHDRLLMEQTGRCQAEPVFDNQGNLHALSGLLQCFEVQSQLAHQSEALTDLSSKTLFKPRKCYVCKERFVHLHPFYHQLCPNCADKNYGYREQTADLTGRIALVTGGRIKIGFEIALKLLRAGATVLVTTRFVQDAIDRYARQADFDDWQDRLHIYGLDLKYVASIELFARYIKTRYTSLDIVINNAAQTLRKTEQFYEYRAMQESICLHRHSDKQYLLDEFEDKVLLANLETYRANVQAKQIGYESSDNTEYGYLNTANQNAINQIHICCTDNYCIKDYYNDNTAIDEFGEPIDFSESNSWVKSLDEVDMVEFLEMQTINATAPFILNARLKSLMITSPFKQRFIINVSAMEGQFNRDNKTCRHPHTNMAKAALNMMTRTSAQEYAKDGIFMNSVDTGWVTQEHTFASRQASRLNGMVPPLDCVDGASRVLAPIFDTLIHTDSTPQFGCFFKDYEVCAW